MLGSHQFTVNQYLGEHMIPRGLRIKKIPTTFYPGTFVQEWNAILSNCSFELMRLIVRYEQECLYKINSNIKDQKEAVNKFAHLPTFTDSENKLQRMIEELETQITQIKRTKYLRDVDDYQSNTVL